MASTRRPPAPPKKLRKDGWLKIRVSPADHVALKLQADANNVSVADYVRAMVGLAPLYRKVREERPASAVPEIQPAPPPAVAIEAQPAPPPVDEEPALSLAALMGFR